MIDFSEATVLAYSHTPQFFGDNLRYKVTQNISVEGWILNLQNFSGVSGIYSGIGQILKGVNDYDSILINGIDFGQGKVLDFNFDREEASKDVQKKKYQATIEVYATGNLFNGNTGYYSGLNWNNAEILNNFSESFSYTRNEDNSSQYTHDISVRFNSGRNLPLTPLQMAKDFASGFFNSLNLTGFLGISYNKFYRKYYTENYNLIDNSADYKQEVQFPIESGVYAITYGHSLELGVDGNINVSEKGNIKGLYDPIYPSLQAGLLSEIPQTFNRCSGVFAYYAPVGAYNINTNPLKKNIDINKFEGSANYEITYTNNPKYSGVYSWEYTTTIDVSLDRVYDITENGKIVGIGRRLLDKYPNALYGYSVVSSGITNRVGNLYSGQNPYPLNLNLVSTVEGFSYYEGQVSYSRTYSDNTTLFPASGIRKFEMSISDKVPVQMANRFNILGVKDLIQPTNQSTLGERNIQIQMIGNRNLPISNFISYASGQLTGFKTLGVDIWTDSAPYKYDPINNKFDLNVIYKYDGVYQSFTNTIFNNSGIKF